MNLKSTYLNGIHRALFGYFLQIMHRAALGFHMSNAVALNLEYLRAGLFAQPAAYAS
jgi:hypothetical protein